MKIFEENQTCLNHQTHFRMTVKPEMTSGQFQGSTFIVITLNQESKLNVPKEKSFPIPLRYIDVTRATNTSLDVLQEHRINDYWNFDVDRDLSAA